MKAVLQERVDAMWARLYGGFEEEVRSIYEERRQALEKLATAADLYFAEGLLQHQKSLLKEIQSLQPDTTDTETSPADTDEAVTNPQAEPGEAPANVAP